jgi:hypothetical protein
VSKKEQREPRTEKERLGAAVRWLRERNSELRRANHELRRINAELRVALQASDVLLGAAMDEVP